MLVVVLHHIAGDGWSTGRWPGMLSVAYAARCRGGSRGGRRCRCSTPTTRCGSGSCWARRTTRAACWPRRWRTGGGVLAGAPEELALPADRPRPAVPSHRGHACGAEVPAGVHRRLAALARAHGVTLFMVVQAALAVLLARLGAGTDIPVGAPVAGRTDAALDELVGFFVNTLVLRTDVSGDPSFAGLLGRVREAGLGALDHQDVPFERLVELLAPERSLARHPLFQVMLTVQNNAPAVLELAPGCGPAGLPAGWQSARFDLDSSVAEVPTCGGRPGGLAGSVTVAADLFDPEAAGMFAGRLVRVLAAVAADPGVRVHQVAVLDAAERELVVAGWNDTAAEVPAGGVPGAVRGAGGAACRMRWRWAGRRVVELRVAGCERAGRLGRGAGGCGGRGRSRWWRWCQERGPELVVALLGCWRRGRRTCRWIRSTRWSGWPSCWPTAVRGWWSVTGGLARGLAERVVWLDDPATASVLAGGPVAGAVGVGAGQLAYVIYTSGSTGVPKGVLVGHGGVGTWRWRWGRCWARVRGAGLRSLPRSGLMRRCWMWRWRWLRGGRWWWRPRRSGPTRCC